MSSYREPCGYTCPKIDSLIDYIKEFTDRVKCDTKEIRDYNIFRSNINQISLFEIDKETIAYAKDKEYTADTLTRSLIEDSTSFYEECVDRLEVLRDSNDSLRSWGHDESDRVDELEEEKSELENKIVDIEEEKESLEDKIGDLEDEIETLKTKVDELEEEIHSLNESIYETA